MTCAVFAVNQRVKVSAQFYILTQSLTFDPLVFINGMSSERCVITEELSQGIQERKSQYEDLLVLESLQSIVSLVLLSFISFNSFWISTLDSSVFSLSVFKGPLFCFKASKSTVIPLFPKIFSPRSSVSSLQLLVRADARSWQQKDVMEQPHSLLRKRTDTKSFTEQVLFQNLPCCQAYSDLLRT